MTHICLIHVVRALEGHETELGALTDANRRRDLINESRDAHKISAENVSSNGSENCPKTHQNIPFSLISSVSFYGPPPSCWSAESR